MLRAFVCMCARESERGRGNTCGYADVCVREWAITHTSEANVEGPQSDTHQHDRASVDAEHDYGGDVQHNVAK